MTKLYDVVAVRHKAAKEVGKPDYVLYYDEDRENAIAYMRKYAKENGFTIQTPDGRMTIATIILRERFATGEVISEVKYHELYDVYGKRIICVK